MTRGSSTLAVLSVLAASVLGVILARTIPSAVFPEIIFRRTMILADSGDLPAEQMLASVTRPLEESVYGVPGVTLVRSTTTRGSAEIDVTFGEDADPQVSFQMLNAAVAHARAQLPNGTAVDALLLTTGTFPIIDLSLSSKVRSLPELTDIVNYDLVPSLHRIDGTYRVGVIGGKYREFVVRLDPARMLQHDMSPGDVVAGLAKNNVIASAGRMNESHRMLLTVVTTDLHQADQLAAVPLTAAGGQPIRVSDVGSVELGIQEDYIRAASENGAAVLVGISRRPSGSTEQVAAEARQILAEFRQRYPDVQFSVSYDQSDLVAESLKSVRDAIVLGLALAVLVVLAFTMSPLSAIVAAVVVPCTVAITFIAMKAVGLTFNMMTLGGLAAGIGLFIDDAIVMIEAIHRELAAGRSTADAVAEALKSLKRPLVASTMTVIVVFGPLVFTSGITGIFFRSLAATLGGGLAISLILAIYFTPAMELAIARFRGRAREAGRIYHGVQTAFLMAIRPVVRFPALAIPGAIVSVCVAYFVYNSIGTDYLPPLDEGAFILDYLTPPQSTMADTTALLDSIQSILKTTPEVAAFSRRTGTQLGFFLTESNRGDMSVRLKADRKREIDDVIDSIRARIMNSVPGVSVEFSQVLQDLIGDLSGVPEPIEVKVFGPDQKMIEATARQVADRMRSIHGLVDVFNGIVESIPEQAVVVDNTSAAHYGLSADDIRAALDSAIQGTVATNVLSGDRLVGVRVRYPDAFHEDLSTLSEVILKSSTGARVPLSSVTKTNFLGATNEIDRERQRPVVHVTARLEGIDLGTAVTEVKRNLARMPLSAGVSLEYGGLYAQQQQAFHELALVLVAGTIMMFLILVWEFARLAPAVACLVAAISCLAGSFIALDVTGMTLNISSFMGIIMVAGITAKNGILLLDHAEREVGAGTQPRAALFDAATVRLRPIMMTTLATAAGLLPLALGYGAGAKVQQPLAIAVIGGLAFAMFLSTPLAGGLYLMGTRQPRPH
ncbi:MAG TPA: efflux RND transporter permease subunit [Candidatus Binatus sp.]|uniref:efflux RND transporter permease subunit n=1 Tax=Candidatus Binatus sp. TaxID=2811406 RepID=UPI002B4694D0|nr:efflux RND transporter permease subunit [Candidatus Binatus sp.]HKN13219.1 efflux RND transporter permease subunit [Candidatus Binatus sp.]